jgi:hypothetical protein
MLRSRTFVLAGLIAALVTASTTLADYKVTVVASGLNSPTGLIVKNPNTLFFTEVPTPGVGGGANAVKELQLRPYRVRSISQGEPEPVNLAFDPRGILYWTCRSAGVILEKGLHPKSSEIAVLLSGLAKPTGIAVDLHGTVYFTQVPTPGVGGGMNSVSSVSVYDATSVYLLSQGEPEPTDIAASNSGELYWTCKSAGVILKRDETGMNSLFLAGLASPTGIALDEARAMLYWTEVPTPGVAGSMGGLNKVWAYNLNTQTKSLINDGDPEPTDIAVSPNGDVYWTCTSAGVIVQATKRGN